MLGVPDTTAYDLRFRFLGIPVRVHPLFWLVTALLGSNSRDPRAILIWIGCVFVSILVHEYGHGLVSRAFGCSPAIVLYGMGGLCYSEADRQSPWQRLAVLIAGPGAGFLFLGALVGGYLALGQPDLNLFGQIALRDLIFINLYWGIVNLFPIWPLDGGQIAGVVLSMINRRKGMNWAHVISLLTAGLIAMWGFQRRDMFLGLFFGYFALMNYQVLQAYHQHAKYGVVEDDADWWKR